MNRGIDDLELTATFEYLGIIIEEGHDLLLQTFRIQKSRTREPMNPPAQQCWEMVLKRNRRARH